LRFANLATLRWTPGTVPLDGGFYAGLWPRPGRLYAFVGGDTALALDTVDTVARRVLTSRPIAGPLLQLARTGDRLVLLAGADNAIVPARLIVIGSDGSVRTVTVQRILAGTQFDRASTDSIGSTNLPGLAVDPVGDVAYVIDASGLVAAVDLSNLSVSYHQLGSVSLLTRIAAWLTPAAEAKGTNGAMLTARWLGKGLIAVAGTRETATAQADSYRPTGLQIVDTRNWSVRTLDSRADTFMVADRRLLVTGPREGLAAYGPDGLLRWRLTGLGEQIYLAQAYRSLALVVGRGAGHLVDLTTGRVRHEASLVGQLLLGAGSTG
jgi:hypothetical protein